MKVMHVERQSNFELLRLLAMLAIVVGHFTDQAALPVNAFVSHGARIAVNVFLLLSCWFLVDREFSWRRIVRVYLEMFAYSFVLTMAMVAVRGLSAVGFRDLMQGILPFYGRGVWYGSAYISLVAMTPFLNRAFALARGERLMLAGVLFAVFVLPSTMPSFAGVDYIADMCWFWVVYVLVGVVKREGWLEHRLAPWLALLVAVTVYAALVWGLRCWPMCCYWLWNIRSLPNFAVAVALFVVFSHLRLPRLRLVNFLAKGLFAVYVFHQTMAFRPYLWERICRAESVRALPPVSATLAALTIALTIVVVVSSFDGLFKLVLSAVFSRSRQNRS